MSSNDPRNCGCQEYVSRRSLLKGVMGGAALAPFAGMLDMQVAFADPIDTTWTGDTVVVLSLRGGFDGLSAVVPMKTKYSDAVCNYDDYAAARPNIAVPQNQLVSLDGTYGLHPRLAPLKTLYDSGHFGAVVAAGMVKPNRSHFEAMEEMERANFGSSVRSGWLGRLMGRHAGALKPLSAVQVGSNTLPVALSGDYPPIGMSSVGSFKLDGINTTFTSAGWKAALTALASGADGGTRDSATTTLGALDDVAAVAAQPSGSGYPNGGLGNALKDVARLIKYGPGVRLVTLDLGDWDMHVELGSFDNGWMYDKLTELSAALTAFAADMGTGLDKVTLVTISEFGRRVHENDSNGVDHGWGNVMFVLGGNVSQGVKGVWPGLSSAAEDKAAQPLASMADGDIYATTDYRAVIAEILRKRGKASPEDVSEVLPGYTGDDSKFSGVISAYA